MNGASGWLHSFSLSPGVHSIEMFTIMAEGVCAQLCMFVLVLVPVWVLMQLTWFD